MIIELAEKYAMLPRGARVLCAVSGGADSVCLLHWLHNNSESLGISVCAAHFEHGIRGEEAMRDARFVEEICREWGIEYRIGHGDVPRYARENSLGTEEAARRLRYEFLRESMQTLGCDRIATAHNADDNAETVIFNLTRGSGSVRGIPPVRGELIRPLLATERREIEAYIAENSLRYVEDSTNASDDYSRNRIRHSVMPVLRDINPAVSKAMLQAAELSARDNEYLDAQAQRFIDESFSRGSLPAKELNALPMPIKSRVIRLMCPVTVGMKNIEGVCALLGETEHRRIMLPQTEIIIEQGRVFFSPEKCEPLSDRELVCPGVTQIPELGLEINARFTEKQKEINDLFKTYLFKRENICGTIIVTRRRPGDKLRPAGRGCTKSLKSLFLEKGYTQRERDTALVFRDDRGILAVAGLCADERTGAKTGDEVLRIDIERIKGYESGD